jgi:hypothetical protein
MIHPAQESDVVPGRKLLGAGGALVATIILCVLVAWGLGRCGSDDWAAVRRTPAAPIPNEVNAMETGVFASEAQGIDTNRRAEEYLHTYGWIDPQRQIVHVPLEVAFELYLSRQAKPAPQQGGAQQGGPQQGGPQQGAQQQGAQQQGAQQQGASKPASGGPS